MTTFVIPGPLAIDGGDDHSHPRQERPARAMWNSLGIVRLRSLAIADTTSIRRNVAASRSSWNGSAQRSLVVDRLRFATSIPLSMHHSTPVANTPADPFSEAPVSYTHLRAHETDSYL